MKELTPREAELLYKEIFETHYDVETKNMNTYTQWQLEVAGIPLLDEGEWDIAVANQYNVTKRTIAELADWLDDEIVFYLTRLKDAVWIYKKIQEYNDYILGLMSRERVGATRLRKDERLQHVVEDCDKLVKLANWLFKACVAEQGEEAYRIFDVLPEEKKTGRLAMRFESPREETIEGDKLSHRIKITDSMSDKLRAGSKMWRSEE